MKKTLSILLCLAFMLVSFTACSSNAMTEKNVTKTVDTAFAALKEFDTDTLQKYVDSSTLNTIVGYAEKHEQLKQLGQAIFENVDYEIKSIDLDKKTVTVTVKNKDLQTSLKRIIPLFNFLQSLVTILFLTPDLPNLKKKLPTLKWKKTVLTSLLILSKEAKISSLPLTIRQKMRYPAERSVQSKQFSENKQ